MELAASDALPPPPAVSDRLRLLLQGTGGYLSMTVAEAILRDNDIWTVNHLASTTAEYQSQVLATAKDWCSRLRWNPDRLIPGFVKLFADAVDVHAAKHARQTPTPKRMHAVDEKKGGRGGRRRVRGRAAVVAEGKADDDEDTATSDDNGATGDDNDATSDDNGAFASGSTTRSRLAVVREDADDEHVHVDDVREDVMQMEQDDGAEIGATGSGGAVAAVAVAAVAVASEISSPFQLGAPFAVGAVFAAFGDTHEAGLGG